MTDHDRKPGRTIIEEFEVAGHQLIGRVKELLKEGNVRQVRIRTDDGDVLLKAPLNVGVIAGGVVALAAPFLAVLGVLAALVTRVRIEVEREAAKAGDTAAAKPEDRQDAA
jgi:hypothetical protein